MTPTEQKALLDAIASALLGWPDDGDRRTYAPEELPRLAERFRRKAEILDAVRAGRDVPEPRGAPTPLEHQERGMCLCDACLGPELAKGVPTCDPIAAVQYHCLMGCGADVSEPMVCLTCFEQQTKGAPQKPEGRRC